MRFFNVAGFYVTAEQLQFYKKKTVIFIIGFLLLSGCAFKKGDSPTEEAKREAPGKNQPDSPITTEPTQLPVPSPTPISKEKDPDSRLLKLNAKVSWEANIHHAPQLFAMQRTFIAQKDSMQFYLDHSITLSEIIPEFIRFEFITGETSLISPLGIKARALNQNNKPTNLELLTKNFKYKDEDQENGKKTATQFSFDLYGLSALLGGGGDCSVMILIQIYNAKAQEPLELSFTLVTPPQQLIVEHEMSIFKDKSKNISLYSENRFLDAPGLNYSLISVLKLGNTSQKQVLLEYDTDILGRVSTTMRYKKTYKDQYGCPANFKKEYSEYKYYTKKFKLLPLSEHLKTEFLNMKEKMLVLIQPNEIKRIGVYAEGILVKDLFINGLPPIESTQTYTDIYGCIWSCLTINQGFSYPESYCKNLPDSPDSPDSLEEEKKKCSWMESCAKACGGRDTCNYTYCHFYEQQYAKSEEEKYCIKSLWDVKKLTDVYEHTVTRTPIVTVLDSNIAMKLRYAFEPEITDPGFRTQYPINSETNKFYPFENAQ